MSQWKIQFAQRAMIVALVCIAIATFILLRAEFNSIYQGPKYTFPIGSILLMFLTAFVGFVGSVLSFILFLFGWIEPSKKSIYFARTKKTFFVMLTIFILAISTVVLSYAIKDGSPHDLTGIIALISMIFMVMSGIASLVLYLAGWEMKQPRSIRETFSIPSVSRDDAGSTAPFEAEDISYSAPERSMFVGRLGRLFTWIAKFVGFMTIPIALLFIAVSYLSFSERGQEGYIILVGPVAFVYIAGIGFGIAIIIAIIGFILKAIERGYKQR